MFPIYSGQGPWGREHGGGRNAGFRISAGLRIDYAYGESPPPPAPLDRPLWIVQGAQDGTNADKPMVFAVGGDVRSERWANARRTFPQLRRNELGERVCRMWGAVRIIFGAIFHDFGASGADLGAMFGSFWVRLEVIWRFRGPNGWRAASWGALGALWGPYGGHLGPFLGAHWGHHGPSWGRQGPSWGHLGAILGRLGAILGRLGAPLGLFE